MPDEKTPSAAPLSPEEKFLAGLDRAIEFNWKQRGTEPSAPSVIASLLNVRESFAAAYDLPMFSKPGDDAAAMLLRLKKLFS